MINIIEDLTKSFEALNCLVEKKLISKKMFAEMYDNVDDFKQEKQELIGFLDEINNFDDEDVDVLNNALMYLHIKVSAAGWQFGEARELIEIIMGRYRKLVREQGYAKD